MSSAMQTSLSGQIQWIIPPWFVREPELEKEQPAQPLEKQIYPWEFLMQGTESWLSLPSQLEIDDELAMLDFYMPPQAVSTYTVKGRITSVSKGSTKLYPTEF